MRRIENEFKNLRKGRQRINLPKKAHREADLSIEIVCYEMNGADPKTKASEIKQLFALGDLDEATKQLIDFAEDFSFKRELKRESVTIAGEYALLSEQKRIYGLTEFTYNKIKRLRGQILQLLDRIVDEFNQKNIDVYKQEIVDSLQTDSHDQTNEKFPEKMEEKDEKLNRYEFAIA